MPERNYGHSPSDDRDDFEVYVISTDGTRVTSEPVGPASFESAKSWPSEIPLPSPVVRILRFFRSSTDDPQSTKEIHATSVDFESIRVADALRGPDRLPARQRVDRNPFTVAASKVQVKPAHLAPLSAEMQAESAEVFAGLESAQRNTPAGPTLSRRRSRH
jgi:hypothetical protein